MLYDLAFGPRHPRPRRQVREWEDPFAWVDIRLAAPSQLAENVRLNRKQAS